jgi:hypothetical protein
MGDRDRLERLIGIAGMLSDQPAPRRSGLSLDFSNSISL